MHNIPVGIDAKDLHIETDPMSAIEVPADRYSGAQTQRSLHHLSTGDDHVPTALCLAYSTVKKAAEVNLADGRLPSHKTGAIIAHLPLRDAHHHDADARRSASATTRCARLARILVDGMEKFRLRSVEGTRLNKKRIHQYVTESAILVNALPPLIGYDKAAEIAHIGPRSLVGAGLAGS
jgi:fumarate hydratase class II